jgi:hypothetical protein
VLLHVSILLTDVARISASGRPDPCVLIAGVKTWAANPILTLAARESSKFCFSFRDGFEYTRSVVLSLHLHELNCRHHVVVEVHYDDRAGRTIASMIASESVRMALSARRSALEMKILRRLACVMAASMCFHPHGSADRNACDRYKFNLVS